MKAIPSLIGFILVMSLVGCGAGKATSKSSSPAPPRPTSSQEHTATGSSNSTSSALSPESMISASQLDAGIKANENWQIIDVREPNEYATGHIPKAINIPLGSLLTRLSEIPKGKDVVLVCLNGTRAFTAWQTLTQKGYDPHRVKVLIGGMKQWKSLGNGEITEDTGG